jgi:hypothetical protein
VTTSAINYVPSDVHRANITTVRQKLVHITSNFVPNKPTLIVIISRKFVAKRSSFVFGAEARSWWPNVSVLSRGGNKCRSMDGNKTQGLISSRYRKSHPQDKINASIMVGTMWKSRWTAMQSNLNSSSSLQSSVTHNVPLNT